MTGFFAGGVAAGDGATAASGTGGTEAARGRCGGGTELELVRETTGGGVGSGAAGLSSSTSTSISPDDSARSASSWISISGTDNGSSFDFFFNSTATTESGIVLFDSFAFARAVFTGC